MPIQHKLISRSVEGAQKKVEEQNFQIRKRVLEYDDVLNKQREVIYGQRQRILEGEDLRSDTLEIVERVITGLIVPFTAESRYPEEWDLEELFVVLRGVWPVSFDVEDLGDAADLDEEELTERLVEDALAHYEKKEAAIGSENMRDLERWVLLRTLDSKWRDHLYEMDYLREGIGLRALAQKDPLVEYKSEGFSMFQGMLDSIQEDFVRYLFHLEVVREEQPREVPQSRLVYTGGDLAPAARSRGAGATPAPAGTRILADTSAQTFAAAQAAGRTATAPRHVEKVGRNDPCPCGSGKKYKKCHGMNE
jgi:preprotein translocase subunit SecA